MPLHRRDVSYLKPAKFQDYLTLAELSDKIKKDPSWIRHLEKEDRIPQARRVKRGKIEIRLWSPEQVEEIQSIIAQHKVGRPKNA